jgi:hypothetical protein
LCLPEKDGNGDKGEDVVEIEVVGVDNITFKVKISTTFETDG